MGLLKKIKQSQKQCTVAFLVHENQGVMTIPFHNNGGKISDRESG